MVECIHAWGSLCFTSCNSALVLSLVTDPSVGHVGVCPPVDEGEAVVGVCADLCDFDSECNETQRCCPTFCGGRSCMETIQIVPPGKLFSMSK